MKIVEIPVFEIDELTAEIQKKICDKYRFYNVEDTYWYDWILKDFTRFFNAMGINLKDDNIFFDDLTSRGQSYFEAFIDFQKLYNTILKNEWQKKFTNIWIEFEPCLCDKRVLKSVLNNNIIPSFHTTVKRNYMEYHSAYQFHKTKNFPNIEKELDKLNEWVENCINKMCQYLYYTLQENYEFETSDGCLINTFCEHEILFTEKGEMFNF